MPPSNKYITGDVFVQAIVSEFKFDRRLRMEEYLELLYGAFQVRRAKAAFTRRGDGRPARNKLKRAHAYLEPSPRDPRSNQCARLS